MKTVSVLIPTQNATPWLAEQLTMLHSQTVPISEIVIIDSESEDNTCDIAATDPLCRILSIRKTEFDHGGTRDFAARTCSSDYLWFLTQDAIPVDSHCLAELLEAVDNADVACAYARQMASASADKIERMNRQSNYPEQSFIRSAQDIPSLQIRAFFLSDTCCLYKRELYLSCGGFQHFLPSNEDMLMAANFLRHGYSTAYCASACVWHTHHMSLAQWYGRSFDTGAFMKMFQRELQGVRAQSEGKKYAFSLMRQLIHDGQIRLLFRFGMICVMRMIGNYDGHRYTNFSLPSVLKRTQNPTFWQKYFDSDKSAAYTLDSPE